MKIFELETRKDAWNLERALDTMFADLGLDVEFSAHFITRLVGREREVTHQEIVSSFKKLKHKWKRTLVVAKKNPKEYKAVLKDVGNDINIVFAIDGDTMKDITIMKHDTSEFGTFEKFRRTQKDLLVGKK